MTIFRTHCIAALAVFAMPALALAQTTPATMAKPVKTLKYLNEADVLPGQMLPPPPARGSAAESAELASLRKLIAATTPARMEQAKWDDTHEDPSIFDSAIGGGFEAKKLSATWELLSIIHNDASVTTNIAKKHFARTRPWGVDPTLPNCDAGKGKQPVGSYPSGHSTLGFSVGYALAKLLPEKAAIILTRAQDYALSRELCGVHFASDTAASHVLATVVAAKLFQLPALQAKIAAARAELKTAGFTKS